MNTVEMKHRKNVDTVRVIAVPTPEEPLEVVIDRAKWHRGKGGPGSKLITFDGKMCCLGFDALACGLKHDDINLRCDPAGTGFGIPGLVDITDAPLWSAEDRKQFMDSEVCREMMEINDSESTTDEEREAALIESAAKVHRKFVFVN